MYSSEMKRRARVLRKEMTREERHLWYDYLRTAPARFIRQHPIGSYILDFYCPSLKLAIELDGSQHYEETGREYDTRRTAALAEKGISVIRFPNNAIWDNFRGVCEQIDLEIHKRETLSHGSLRSP